MAESASRFTASLPKLQFVVKGQYQCPSFTIELDLGCWADSVLETLKQVADQREMYQQMGVDLESPEDVLPAMKGRM